MRAHIRAMLQGNQGPLRDIVLLNAARHCWSQARRRVCARAWRSRRSSIDTGRAKSVLEALVALSHDKV